MWLSKRGNTVDEDDRPDAALAVTEIVDDVEPTVAGAADGAGSDKAHIVVAEKKEGDSQNDRDDEDQEDDEELEARLSWTRGVACSAVSSQS
jgi:hypothetical protein